MVTKSIKYKDFDGNTVTEKFYFNLTDVELSEIDLDISGGMLKAAQLIQKTEDVRGMIALIKALIKKSYGEFVDAGSKKRFIKSPEITSAFMSSDAYSKLFVDLFSSTDKTIEFITGILPSEMGAQVRQSVKEQMAEKERELEEKKATAEAEVKEIPAETSAQA